MGIQVVIIYCLTDEMLQATGHTEPPQRRMSDAEILTTALASARLFGGNFASARLYLESEGYVPHMLEKSQFNRRLHRAAPLMKQLFQMLGESWKAQNEEDVYLVDSFPIPVCDNIRISQCHIYQKEAFRGYVASKRRFFFGLRIHMMATAKGQPVEVFLAPGGRNDTRATGTIRFQPSGRFHRLWRQSL